MEELQNNGEIINHGVTSKDIARVEEALALWSISHVPKMEVYHINTFNFGQKDVIEIVGKNLPIMNLQP